MARTAEGVCTGLPSVLCRAAWRAIKPFHIGIVVVVVNVKFCITVVIFVIIIVVIGVSVVVLRTLLFGCKQKRENKSLGRSNICCS